MKNLMETDALQALDDFSFSIQDYACDGGKDVMKKAREHLRQRLGDILVPEEYVSAIVRAKYLSMIMGSVSWICLPAGGRTEISFSKDNIAVTGKVRIDPKRVHVELSMAGNTYSKDSILLAMTPRIYTEAPFVGSPANKDGEECAKALFLKLYYETLFRKD